MPRGESDLAAQEEHQMTAGSTKAWLMTLRERVAEVEEDAAEAFEKRRQLAKLLVERIAVGRDEDGAIQVRITYRFGPPHSLNEDEFVTGVQNSSRSSALNG